MDNKSAKIPCSHAAQHCISSIYWDASVDIKHRMIGRRTCVKCSLVTDRLDRGLFQPGARPIAGQLCIANDEPTNDLALNVLAAAVPLQGKGVVGASSARLILVVSARSLRLLFNLYTLLAACAILL